MLRLNSVNRRSDLIIFICGIYLHVVICFHIMNVCASVIFIGFCAGATYRVINGLVHSPNRNIPSGIFLGVFRSNTWHGGNVTSSACPVGQKCVRKIIYRRFSVLYALLITTFGDIKFIKVVFTLPFTFSCITMSCLKDMKIKI